MSKKAVKSKKKAEKTDEKEEAEEKVEKVARQPKKKTTKAPLPLDNLVVIDATDLIRGRLASVVATRLLRGERVAIVNSEKAVITGKKNMIVLRYKSKLQIKTHTAPWKGPFHYRRPDRIVKRTIRGMLPWKKPRGKAAYKRLRVYIGVPEYLSQIPIQTVSEAHVKKTESSYITVETLSNEMGWVSPLNRA